MHICLAYHIKVTNEKVSLLFIPIMKITILRNQNCCASEKSENLDKRANAVNVDMNEKKGHNGTKMTGRR